jgi:hypothetical protein
MNAPRRPVGERWFYNPVVDLHGSSSVSEDISDSSAIPDAVMLASARDDPNDLVLGPVRYGVTPADLLSAPLTRLQTQQMVKRFRAEGKSRRRQFKKDLRWEWENQVAPAFDQENDKPGADILIDEEYAHHDFMSVRLA